MAWKRCVAYLYLGIEKEGQQTNIEDCGRRFTKKWSGDEISLSCMRRGCDWSGEVAFSFGGDQKTASNLWWIQDARSRLYPPYYKTTKYIFTGTSWIVLVILMI